MTGISAKSNVISLLYGRKVLDLLDHLSLDRFFIETTLFYIETEVLCIENPISM